MSGNTHRYIVDVFLKNEHEAYKSQDEYNYQI